MDEGVKLTEYTVTDISQYASVFTQMEDWLHKMQPGAKIKITLEVVTDISPMKKRYFAMVRELSLYAGYNSHAEREVFKEQVRQQLQIKSIKDIVTKEDMSSAIEALHQLAGEHYTYKFKDGKADHITFDFGPSRTE